MFGLRVWLLIFDLCRFWWRSFVFSMLVVGVKEKVSGEREDRFIIFRDFCFGV